MGLLESLVNIGANIGANRQARKLQEEANEQNINFWRMQNEYNHPSAQMARMRQAGLNPALMYGQSSGGAAGNAGSISPAKAPENKPVANLPMLNYADIKQREAQTDNLRAQNTVLAQDAMLKIAQAQHLDSNRYMTEFDLRQKQRLRETMYNIQNATLEDLNQTITGKKIANQVNSALVNTSIDAKRLEVQKTQQEIIGKKIENTIADKTQQIEIQNAVLEFSQRVKGLQGQDLENEIKAIELDLRRKGLTSHDNFIFRMITRLVGNPDVQMLFDKIDNAGKGGGAKRSAKTKFK